MNYASAISILKEGYDLLYNIGMPCWLSAGTALGAHRDNFNVKFVEKDTDIDVGIIGIGLGEKQYFDIVSLFTSKGFTLFRTYKGNNKRTQIAMKKDGIVFDIYIFYIAGENICSYTEHGIMIKPLKFVNNMSTISIANNKYCVPTPIDDYLALRYGENWDIPINEKVSWETECTNMHKKKVRVTNMYTLDE